MNSGSRQLTSATDDPRLVELVDVITRRLQEGESVDFESYAAEFPEYADHLQRWIAAMTAMLQLGKSFAAKEDSAALPEMTDTNLAGRLGDYQIIREIARGGMGVVYEAQQISLRRRVALKVLPFASVLDGRQLARFENEARAAAMLKHPNIVSVYSVGCDRGVHHYAMEYVDGQSLAEVVRVVRDGTCDFHPSPKLPEHASDPRDRDDTEPIAALSTQRSVRPADYYRHVAQLGIDAAEALQYAHEMGVVHRDVKPSNLLLDRRNHLWVTDFGLATTERDAGLTLTGDVLGTLRYMSPEAAAGGVTRGVVDHRSDVYSLGVTLYELLTLQAAFPEPDRAKLLQSIVEDDPRPPRQVMASIPVDLDTIVLKAIAKEPADRYRTMQELADDLRRYTEGLPVEAKRPGAVQQTAKWLRRHQYLAWSAAAAVLVVAVAMSLAWRREADLRAAAESQQQRAEQNLRVARRLITEVVAPTAERIGPLPGSQIWRHELLDQAIAMFRQLSDQSNDVTAQQDLANLYKIRADSCYLLGRDMGPDCHAALAILERLAAEHPRDEGIRFALIVAYGALQRHCTQQLRFTDSLSTNQKRLRLHDSLSERHAEWRDLIMERGRYLRLTGDPGEAEWHTRQSLQLMMEEETSEAYGMESLAARSYHLWPLVELGHLSEAERVANEALRIGEQILTNDPDPVAQKWVADLSRDGAWISNHLRQPEEGERRARDAIAVYRRLHQEFPDVVWAPRFLGRAQLYLGESLIQMKRWDEAEAVLCEASQNLEDAGRQYDLYLLGLVQFRLGELLTVMHREEEAAGAIATALKQFEQTAQRHPREPWCNRRLVILLTMSPPEEFRDANRAVEIASRILPPAAPLYWRYLALAQYRAGQFDEAIRSAQEAIALMSEGQAMEQMLVALAYWRKGQPTEARQWHQRAVRAVDGGEPILFYDMGPLSLRMLREETDQITDSNNQSLTGPFDE